MSDKKLTLSFDPVTPDSFCQESQLGAFKISGPEGARTISALMAATFSRNRMAKPELGIPALEDGIREWIDTHLTQEDGVPTSVHEVTGLLYAAALLEARACAIIGKGDPAAALGVAGSMNVTRVKYAMIENGYDEDILDAAMDPWVWGPDALVPILQNVDTAGCPCGQCGRDPHPDAPEREIHDPVEHMTDAILSVMPPEQREQAKKMLAKLREMDPDAPMIPDGAFEAKVSKDDTPESMAKTMADALEREAGIVLNAAQRQLIVDDVSANWEAIQRGDHVMAIKIPKNLS